MLDNNTTSAGKPARPVSAFTIFLRTRFPGLRYTSDQLRRGGRIFKERGEEEAHAFMEGKGEVDPYNARPPAKCDILAWNRPPSEWPIALASRDVQLAVFAQHLNHHETLEKGFTATETGRAFALHRLGLRDIGIHAQGMNDIIKNALKTYNGVLIKVANYNQKKAAKHARVNDRKREQGFETDDAPTLKVATNEEGFLTEPPGMNPCIQTYQQVSPRAIAHTKGLDSMPEKFRNYTRDPNAPLRSTEKLDRLSILPGMPGYIPEFQRPFLSTKKGRRHRNWYSSGCNRPKRGRRPESPERALAREAARDEGALLVLIKIGEDWLLLDARGLLRSVVYREIAPEGLSLLGLLDMFTGTPVIDPIHRVVTFCFKQGVVPIRKQKTTPTKKAPELLKSLVAAHGMIGMVSIDLGQTNPIAARVSRLGEGLEPDFVSQLALPNDLKVEWARYRSDSDQLEARLRQEAVESLSETHQAEVAHVRAYCPADGKQLLAARFDVDLSDLPWELMTSSTCYIADRVLRDRPLEADLVHFVNKQKGRLKRTDFNIYRWTRPKLTKETGDTLNTALWTLKTKSPEYAKLSQRKRELSRRCANWIVRATRRMTRCKVVVVNVEDLNMRFFHGAGKRDVGWNQFFLAKRENRWLIQALHKALTELAPHQGVAVIEVTAARTSITCPSCGVCDRKSRDGEAFRCVGCGVELHADFEVATTNIERVALTGQAMPKPKSERVRAAKKPRAARNGSPRRNSKGKADADPAPTNNRDVDMAAE